MELTLPRAEDLYAHMKAGIEELLGKLDPDSVHLVGIYSGGAWLVERLQKDLKLQNPSGVINTSLYRDDFHKIGLHSQVLPSSIPFEVNGKHIIMVDDILYTGRTTRAAINELFDYGRPASISLAVLIDRGGRELPVAPNVAGGVIPLEKGTNFVLSQNEQRLFDIDLKKENVGA